MSKPKKTKATKPGEKSRYAKVPFPAPRDPGHYICNICGLDVTSRHWAYRHFRVSCTFHKPRNARWDDHPSCLTPEDALVLQHTRPLYPDQQTLDRETGQITLIWPKDSGWPTEPEELNRKNVTHLAIPGSNRFFVDTHQNVYTDAVLQSQHAYADCKLMVDLFDFIQLVNPPSVTRLKQAQAEGTRKHGVVDDVVFTLSLHRSSASIAELMGCDLRLVQTWTFQAEAAFFQAHMKTEEGPDSIERNIAWAEMKHERFADALETFRATHHAGPEERWNKMPCCDGQRIEEAFAEGGDTNETGYFQQRGRFMRGWNDQQ